MPRTATADRVDLPALLDFVRPRHHVLLGTFRADGRVQLSPVTAGLDDAGRLVLVRRLVREGFLRRSAAAA